MTFRLIAIKLHPQQLAHWLPCCFYLLIFRLHNAHIPFRKRIIPSPLTPQSEKKYYLISFHSPFNFHSVHDCISLAVLCMCINCQLSFISAGECVCLYGTIQVFHVDANIVLPFSWCCCCFFFFGFYSISQFQIQTYKRISVVLMLVVEFMAKQIENKEFYCCLFPSAIHSPKCNPKTWRRKKTSNTKKRSVSVCTVTILCDTFRVHKHKDVNGEGSEK